MIYKFSDAIKNYLFNLDKANKEKAFLIFASSKMYIKLGLLNI